MKNISNTTLTALLVIAVITTIGGVLAILVKIGFGFGQITGFAASAIGTVNVTVSSTVGIRLSGITNITFGSGVLNGDSTTTFLNTTASSLPGGFSTSMDFQLENSGNVRANISVNGTTATNFLGGTSPLFAVNATCATTESTPCNQSFNVTFPSTVPVNMTGGLSMVVNNTNATDNGDLFNISVFVGIPQDVIAGAKNATVTFWAVSA